MRRLLLPILLLSAGLAAAREVPYLTGRVNDTAHLLSAEESSRLETQLAELEKATGAQVAVLTVDSLEGDSLEDFSMRVAETWKLGKKGKDDGVLLLIAKNDRKMRLEVGYGLEAKLTDAQSVRILDNVIKPRFKQGQFGPGIEEGVTAVGGTLLGRADAIPAEAPPGNDMGDAPWPARLAGMGLFTLVVGVFSVIAVFSAGCMSWFLYVFLMPFWALFPSAFLGRPGFFFGPAWIVAFPILKLLLRKTPAGKSFLKAHPGLAGFAATTGTSGWRGSSGGSSWSSSSGGSSFSGGGGSFGGGGASSSW